jgi:hypothetical protein
MRHISLTDQNVAGYYVYFFKDVIIVSDGHAVPSFLVAQGQMPDNPIVCHESHPLRKLAQTFADQPDDPAITRLLEPYLYGATVLDNAKRFANGSDSLERWAQMHSASLYLLLQDQSKDGPHYSRITWEDKGVVALAWLMKRDIEYLRRGGNAELDCSHPSMPPYLFSLPMTVCHNYGIPLG